MKKIVSFLFLSFFLLPFSAFALESNKLIPKLETIGLQTPFTQASNNEKCYIYDRQAHQYVNNKQVFDCRTIATLNNGDYVKKTDQYTIYTQVEINWLSQHINTIYVASLSFGTVICVLIIMWAGFRWIAAGGNQDIIGRAKEYISNGLIGLVLLFGSYLILYTLNPATTNLKPVTINRPNSLSFAFKKIGNDLTPDLPDKWSDISFFASHLGIDSKDKATIEKFNQNKEYLDKNYGISCQTSFESCSEFKLACDYNSFDQRERFCRPGQANAVGVGSWNGPDGIIPIGRICGTSDDCYLNDFTNDTLSVCCAPINQNTRDANNHQIRQCVYAQKIDKKWVYKFDFNKECVGK